MEENTLKNLIGEHTSIAIYDSEGRPLVMGKHYRLVEEKKRGYNFSLYRLGTENFYPLPTIYFAKSLNLFWLKRGLSLTIRRKVSYEYESID